MNQHHIIYYSIIFIEFYRIKTGNLKIRINYEIIAVENSSYQMRKVKQPKKWGNPKSEATFYRRPRKRSQFFIKSLKKNQKSHKLNLSTPACKKYNKDSILLNAFHWIF